MVSINVENTIETIIIKHISGFKYKKQYHNVFKQLDDKITT